MDIFQDLLGCLSIHYGHFTLHVHFLERSSPFWLQSAARFRTYQIDLLLPICLELFRAILCLSPDCCRWCHFRMMIFNTQSSWLQWWPHVSLSTMSFWKMRSGRVGNACFGNDVLMFDFLVVLDFALISAVVCMFRIFTSFCKDQHFRFDSSLLFRDEKPLKTLQQKCSMFNVANAPSCCASLFWYFFNRRFDTENSGYIRREDLFKVLESESEALQVMKELDVNNDGKISYEEFIGTSESNEKQQYGYSYIAFRWFNDMGFWWVLLSGRVLLSSFVLVFIIIILFVFVACLSLFGCWGYLKNGGAADDTLEAAERAISREIICRHRRWPMTDVYPKGNWDTSSNHKCNHRLFLKYHWF